MARQIRMELSYPAVRKLLVMSQGVSEVGIEHITEMASYLPRALQVSSCFIAGASLEYRIV